MSKQEELEAKIREQRTVEANKKGLIGQNGKIGVVLRVFGSPIIGQSVGGVYIDTNRADFIPHYDEEDPKNSYELMRSIPIADVEGIERPKGSDWADMNDPDPITTYNLGWHFDGLSRGMHLEILYKDDSSAFTVHHKGHLVYKELRGELMAYLPNDEWEGWIMRLSKSAREIMRQRKEKEFAAQVKVAERTKASWWESMKARWGVT